MEQHILHGRIAGRQFGWSSKRIQSGLAGVKQNLSRIAGDDHPRQ